MKGPLWQLMSPAGQVVGSLQVESGPEYITRMTVYLPTPASEAFFSSLAIHGQLPAGYSFHLPK